MKRIVLHLLMIFFIPINSMAADWFVDNAANGVNNGKSWGNAWESFADINWGKIDPGDTIYISGGVVSKTYFEKLAVGSSGSKGYPITITAGVDANHNGEVIIDGEDIRNCIVFESEDYIRVSYLNCIKAGQNSGSGAFHIDSCISVKIKFCSIEEINTHGAVWIDTSADCVIGYNTMTTRTDTGKQVDGIYAQRNDGNIYEFNNISILNNNDAPHCDGIQLFKERDYIIRGNIVTVDNNSKDNKQGIYCENNHGTSFIYNNLVIYDTGAWGSLIAHYNVNSGYTGVVNVYNNTCVSLSGTGKLLTVIGDNNAKIKNNIFWRQHGTSEVVSYGSNSNKINFTPGNIDYNIYYSGANDIIRYNGSSLNLDEWQALDHDLHSMDVDPFLDSDYKPKDSNAPPVDEGVSLSNIFTDDIDGISRPQRKAWDIGAYEYYTGLPSNEPEETGGGGGGGGCFITTAGWESSPWVFLLTPAGCIIMLLMLVIGRKLISYEIVPR